MIAPGALSYFVTRAHRYTVAPFLREWAPDLAQRFQVHDYEDGFDEARCAGLVIFSDLDRLSQGELAQASAFADRLRLGGRRVLNPPAQVLGRAALLGRLTDAGLNSFRAFTLADLLAGPRLRYPVFLRRERDHAGALTGKLPGPGALASQVLKRRLKGVRLRDLLVVEVEDVADPSTGIVRKYSYLRIGDQFIPRHVLFGHDWVLKFSSLYEPDMAREEEAFLQEPVPPEIRAAFDIAGVTYGRIDFSRRPRDGAVQIWEINTNPSLSAARSAVLEARRPLQEKVLRRVTEAFVQEIEGFQDRPGRERGFRADGTAGRSGRGARLL